MKKAEFPYCRAGKGEKICDCTDPYLDIELKFGGASMFFEALVDSGCSTTLIDAEIGTALGVDYRTCIETEVIGVGAIVKGYLTTIEFCVPGMKVFNGRAIFVNDLPVSILLGQDDFFNNFKVCFMKKEYKFFLQQV